MIFPYLASIFAGIFYGITESINKDITEEKYSAFAYAFLQHFFISLLYLIPAIFYFRWPTSPVSYIFLGLSILITLSANTLDIKAYKTEDISNITIVGNINLVISFLTGVVLLSEPVNQFKIIGLSTVIIGIMIIFYKGKKIYFTKGLLFALLSGVIWGFSGLVDKLGLSSINIISYTLLTQGSLAILLFFHPAVRRDAPVIWHKYKVKIIIARLVVVVGLFLFYWSIMRGEISIVRTNSTTFFLLTTLIIGTLFLKERKRIVNKIAGALVCILGIVLLNLF